MALTPTNASNLSGLFKEAYGEDLINLTPDSAKLVKLIPFVSRDLESGNAYHQPVIVSNENGITHDASGTAFDLSDNVSMQTQDAQISGAQILLRSAISYTAAAKASNSKKAFVKATDLLVTNMLESITKRLELELLYGQTAKATTSAYTAVGGSTTTGYVTISDASFSAGILAGMEGAKIVFYAASDTLVSSGADSIFTVTAIDVDNKKILVTGTATGITALASAAASPNACSIYFNTEVTGTTSAFAHNCAAGLKKIITNSGVLFNINASTYSLWKGNTVTESGQMTFGKVLAATSKAVSRGLQEKVVVICSSATFANLASDLAALRRYDGDYSKKAEQGFESLKYYGQNGEIEIMPHLLCKDGDMFIFPLKQAKRLGEQEISFKNHFTGDDIFLHMANNAGFELRVFSSQAFFMQTPAKCVYVTGFTNA